MAVLLLFPLELMTGYLGRAAAALADLLGGMGGATYESPIKGVIKAGTVPIEVALGALIPSCGRVGVRVEIGPRHRCVNRGDSVASDLSAGGTCRGRAHWRGADRRRCPDQGVHQARCDPGRVGSTIGFRSGFPEPPTPAMHSTTNPIPSFDPARARVCVVGAGAMGGLIGAKLLDAEVDVTLIDRGERLGRLRAAGLILIGADGRRREYPDVRAVDAGAAGGLYDIVFVAVKAYDLPHLATQLPALNGPDAVLVTLQNGIPWWYFHRHGGNLDGRSLRSLDPDGLLARHVDADRVVACIPYPAAEVMADGAVKHVEGFKLPVGELDGSMSPRIQRVSALLQAAGFRSRILDDVRSETWLKAWGNLAFNPISALTGATLEDLCRFEPTRELAARMMREAQQVAEALGAKFRVEIEQRIAGAEAVGPHKTSMLQDLERGARLETEALVGAVLELAEAKGIDTPSVRAVYAAVRLLEQTRAGRNFRGERTPPPASLAGISGPGN